MKHFILFTGHMIDSKERKEPRFPAYKEEPVRQKIYQHLLQQKQKIKNHLNGVASGACGGDILFHEVCAELNITSEVHLALPIDEFKKNSVSFAGENWDKRFDKLIKNSPVHVLPKNRQNTTNKNVYELTNEWMLETALPSGGQNMTLLALWNGDVGDGKGGTQHMINIAKEAGAAVEIIDINKV